MLSARDALALLFARRTDIGSSAELLDDSIRHTVAALAFQVAAKASLPTPVPPTNVVYVKPGDSLPAVLDGLSGGEVVIVSPEVVTNVSDLTLAKPVTLVGAVITALIDVTAPDVSLVGCTVTGSRDTGAIVATADRLLIKSCTLRGSPQGQHRGVYVRSAGVRVLDSTITGCCKTGQEAQAIAGWSGVRHLLVERCLLEGAGENLIIGGADCPEDQIPEDVIVRDCTMRKPLEWRNAGFVVKNLIEFKNVRRALVERCLFEYCWVEGQTGFGVLFTVKNQDGTAPWSTLEDLTFRENTIRHTAGGIQILGTDYMHPSDVLKRLTVEDNVFEDISAQWGSNGRCIQTSHGGEDVAFRRNRMSGTDINSFLTFEGAPIQRFIFEGNTVPEGWYAIKSDDTAIGTPTLEKYAPGYVWNANTVIRTVPTNNYPYPSGTTVIPG